MTPPNIRIKDIAKMAGVSEGTVDRVLHNRGNVSADALNKVKNVLEKIHYRPNLLARSLGRSKNYRISVLIPEPKDDPYWGVVNAGIIQAKKEWENYGVIIDPFFYVHDGDLSLKLIADQSIKSKPDGIVVAPIFYPQAITVFKKLQKMAIPYVLFNTNVPESKPLSFIGQDLFQSGMLAGQLMSIGSDAPEEILILHIGEDIEDSIYLMEKEKGFRQYYEKNIRHDVNIHSINLDENERSLKRDIEALVKSKNTTGIFVSTSKPVSVVAQVLQNSSRTDIRLIGYDMLEENLNFLKNGWISFLINQNPKRQVFQGISHMANHLLFKKEVPCTELFPLEVITQQNVNSYITSGIH
jgi:LacI family transcriptional regulator